MKHLLFILILLTHVQFVHGQTKAKQEKHWEEKGDFNCVYKPKYSAAQRSKFYPFNIADTIKLVSFRYHMKKCPIKKDTLVADSLIEVRTLAKAQIDSLTNILYNNFYKIAPNYGSINQCYFPRNAILFIDKEGKLKESMTICFYCDRIQESSQKVILGDDCSQKMEKLRKFFVSKQVIFGTNREVDKYPGEDHNDELIEVKQ